MQIDIHARDRSGSAPGPPHSANQPMLCALQVENPSVSKVSCALTSVQLRDCVDAGIRHASGADACAR